ncbi:hypothetical protein [Methanofollis fontis]|uniref:hypothetical protein n=1 Tax=Methanofollis fontis TaxID=2052832 RepID=UPI001A931860|nr:hypothetical protein [Methanofollis fontis]
MRTERIGWRHPPGSTIPPNADCYRVGDAGPGPGYIEAGGEESEQTGKSPGRHPNAF